MSHMPKFMGIASIVVGALAIVVGVTVFLVVRSELSAQKITVSSDAPFLEGHDVAGPFTAYAQALALSDHAKSLYTSVVAFAVSVLIAALGLVFIFVGFAFRELDRRTAAEPVTADFAVAG